MVKYKRVVLKLSGEALMGDQAFGIDPKVTARVSAELSKVVAMGVRIAIVVGGGNIYRGVSLAAQGAERVPADHMGMLATAMNGLALRMALTQAGVDAVVMSALPMPNVCETFTQRGYESHLAAGRVVISVGGTGSPFFTTDTPAALRACEMGADAILKGTQVDGIYSADPKKDKTAERFDTISHEDVLAKGLSVMDAAAVSLAQQADIPIIVFSIHEPGALVAVLKGEGRYTTVS